MAFKRADWVVWTCDANERREDIYENATHKNGGKRTKMKTQNQMDRANQKIYRNESGKLERITL